MTTTTFELDGYRVTKTLGVVRGIIVRSRSIIGNFAAGLQTLVGGNITLLTELCEDLAADFDVSVICGGARQVVENVSPDAEQLCEHRGVRIRRVRQAQFDKASFVGRLANMLTFQVAATFSALFAPRWSVQAHR